MAKFLEVLKSAFPILDVTSSKKSHVESLSDERCLPLSNDEKRLHNLVKVYQQALEVSNFDLANQVVKELTDLTLQKIYRYVSLRVGNQADSEDVVTQIFHRMSNGLSEFKPQNASFSAWLYRIAHSQLIKKISYLSRQRERHGQLKQTNIQSHVGSQEPSLQLGNTEPALVDIQPNLLHAMIKALPEVYQELLYLNLSGYTNEEIGYIMDKTAEEIGVLYYSALAAMRDEMQEG